MELNEGAFWWGIGFLCGLAVVGMFNLAAFLNEKFVPQDDDRGFGPGVDYPSASYDNWPPKVVGTKLAEHERWSFDNTVAEEPADAPIQFKKKLPRKRKPQPKKSR